MLETVERRLKCVLKAPGAFGSVSFLSFASPFCPGKVLQDVFVFSVLFVFFKLIV